MSYSRERQCLGNGGVSELYAFPYVKYSRSQTPISNNYLTSFPYSSIYKLKGNSINFSEDVSDEDGGLQVAQSLAFNLNKITPNDNLSDFVNKEWRFVIKDENGYYRMLGLRKSLNGSYKKDTGVNKSDFNGFNVLFSGLEELEAPFLEDLSGFDINGSLSLEEILETVL